MKAKDTLLLNNTVSQNPKSQLWHVAPHIMIKLYLHCDFSHEGKVCIFLMVKNVDAYSKTNGRYFQN